VSGLLSVIFFVENSSFNCDEADGMGAIGELSSGGSSSNFNSSIQIVPLPPTKEATVNSILSIRFSY